jgi:hypothetical protein
MYVNQLDYPLWEGVFIDLSKSLPQPILVVPSSDVAVGNVTLIVNPKPPSEQWLADHPTAQEHWDRFLKFMKLDDGFFGFIDSHPGQRFLVLAPHEDPSADYVSIAITGILGGNGWKNVGQFFGDYPTTFKMLVEINPDEPPSGTTAKTADALLGELKRIGAADEDLPLISNRTDNVQLGVIDIRVGRVPYLGDFPPVIPY